MNSSNLVLLCLFVGGCDREREHLIKTSHSIVTALIYTGQKRLEPFPPEYTIRAKVSASQPAKLCRYVNVVSNPL